MRNDCEGGKGKGIVALVVAGLILLHQAIAGAADGGRQLSYGSPGEAVQALVGALERSNLAGVSDILGPGGAPLLSSGDEVADRTERAEFLSLYRQSHRIEVDPSEPDLAVLMVGEQDYPLPIPVVRRGGGWIFDTEAGLEEILDRRIGLNELEAIEVAEAYVDAQRAYSAQSPAPGAAPQYAQQLVSTPGRKDGLYWRAGRGEGESPLATLIYQAAREGYPNPQEKWPAPFHGYYFKVLKGQGEHAKGGSRDYVVNGRMERGFALLAYPARYGVSGIMTFMVNQDGIVYEKDLGPETTVVAPGIRLFDPDKGWREVGGEGEHLPTVSDVEVPELRTRLK